MDVLEWSKSLYKCWLKLVEKLSGKLKRGCVSPGMQAMLRTSVNPSRRWEHEQRTRGGCWRIGVVMTAWNNGMHEAYTWYTITYQVLLLVPERGSCAVHIIQQNNTMSRYHQNLKNRRGALLPPSPLLYEYGTCLDFYREKIQPFFPSSTRVQLCYFTLKPRFRQLVSFEK